MKRKHFLYAWLTFLLACWLFCPKAKASSTAEAQLTISVTVVPSSLNTNPQYIQTQYAIPMANTSTGMIYLTYTERKSCKAYLGCFIIKTWVY